MRSPSSTTAAAPAPSSSPSPASSARASSTPSASSSTPSPSSSASPPTSRCKRGRSCIIALKTRVTRGLVRKTPVFSGPPNAECNSQDRPLFRWLTGWGRAGRRSGMRRLGLGLGMLLVVGCQKPSAEAPETKASPVEKAPEKAAPAAAPASATAELGQATAGGLSWDDPAPLVRRRPKGSMRAAEYGVQGDPQAELTVFYFGPDQGGSVEVDGLALVVTAHAGGWQRYGQQGQAHAAAGRRHGSDGGGSQRPLLGRHGHARRAGSSRAARRDAARRHRARPSRRGVLQVGRPSRRGPKARAPVSTR